VATSPGVDWFEVETKSMRHVTLERPIRAHADQPAARATGESGRSLSVRGPSSDRDAASGALAAGRRYWRQIRLACSFAQFGVTALAVAFVVAPVVRLSAASSEQAEMAVQRAIRRAYAFSVALWRLVGIFRLDARGLAGLADCGPCIVVANHPTLVDVVLIGSVLEQMDCIVNAGWTAKSPFLARAIEVAGYVRNDGGVAVVEQCARRLRSGRRLLVFPEGTRSPWGSFGKFHRGAAHIALASGAPLVAVAIRCRPRMLGSGRKWSDTDGRRPAYELAIAGRLDPADYAGMTTPLAARKMTDDLLRIFLEEPNLADA